MKTVVTIIIGVFIFTSCSSRKIEEAGWEITVRGKVGFPQPGVITLHELTPDNTGKVDSIALGSDYTFTKKIRLTHPGFYQLSFYGMQILNVILNKSDLEVNVDGNNMQGFAEVKGSPEHDLIAKVQQMMGSITSIPELVSIEKQFNEAAQKHDESKIASLRSEYMTVVKKEHDKVAELLLQQPASLAVLNLLMQGNLLDRDAYARVYEDAAQKLKKEFPDSPMAKEFIDQVERVKTTSVGKQAPEIALPNPQGVTMRLSSLRGKYVLVDFWAKWCGPCRRENPNVVAAYHKYKNKGFEVFGVSLDRNKEDWIQAIEQDGLAWTHVSDLKYFNSEAARLYNINAIPFSVLLDPKGIIIAKNLRGADLDKKLEEILGK